MNSTLLNNTPSIQRLQKPGLMTLSGLGCDEKMGTRQGFPPVCSVLCLFNPCFLSHLKCFFVFFRSFVHYLKQLLMVFPAKLFEFL